VALARIVTMTALFLRFEAPEMSVDAYRTLQIAL
jgi:hypothetical protein